MCVGWEGYRCIARWGFRFPKKQREPCLEPKDSKTRRREKALLYLAAPAAGAW